MAKHQTVKNLSLAAVIDADRWARQTAQEIL
jgi:hypothetical protein